VRARLERLDEVLLCVGANLHYILRFHYTLDCAPVAAVLRERAHEKRMLARRPRFALLRYRVLLSCLFQGRLHIRQL